jgi:hypothetical protein
MKTIVLSLLLLGFLTLPGGSSLDAADPTAPVLKGKILILKNEHTMEGDIERVGDRYRLRRLTGETWVHAEGVLCLVESLPDAYAFLRARANLEDADERLRLANWCRLNGLREQALIEIQAAAALRPNHAETRRILQHLQQAARTPAAPKPIAAAALDKPALEALPPVEVTADSLGLFATRVQPILMNTCARCHATGRGGKFHLTQVYDDGFSNRRTLERNLAAVLGQVNLNQPEASRLLAKAVSDHAHTGQAPLKSRKETPYRTLESWVKLTVANNPHLRDSQPASAAPPLSPTSERRSAAPEPRSEWGAEARSPITPVSPALPAPSAAPVPVSNTAAAPPPPPPPATPADPYDPELFNRRLHPETAKPAPGK